MRLVPLFGHATLFLKSENMLMIVKRPKCDRKIPCARRFLLIMHVVLRQLTGCQPHVNK